MSTTEMACRLADQTGFEAVENWVVWRGEPVLKFAKSPDVTPNRFRVMEDTWPLTVLINGPVEEMDGLAYYLPLKDPSEYWTEGELDRAREAIRSKIDVDPTLGIVLDTLDAVMRGEPIERWTLYEVIVDLIDHTEIRHGRFWGNVFDNPPETSHVFHRIFWFFRRILWTTMAAIDC